MDVVEVERKYDVDRWRPLPAFEQALPESARLETDAPTMLDATYFDTEDLDLNQHQITLRRRVGGDDEGWHLKLPVRKDTRQERYAPLDESAAGSVPARLAAQVEDITAGRRLRPIAILDTDRTVWTLTSAAGDALVEVADDQVTAVKLSETDSKPLTWREVEVEVKSSDPEAAELLGTVGKVLREAGARPSASGSKLARLLQS